MELIKVSFEKKMILRNLMELYQYDMSDFEDDGENDVMFKGNWIVSWLESNLPAKTFWTKAK